MVRQPVLAVLLFLSLAVSLAFAGSLTLRPGNTFHCRLSQTLSTGINSAGDRFTASIAEPVYLNGVAVIPAGALVEGRITNLKKPGHLAGVGQMLLLPERIRLSNGRAYPVSAQLVRIDGAEGVKVANDEGWLQGPSSRLKTLAAVGKGAGAGGVVGLIAGHTPLGLAIGSATGFIVHARHRGQDLNLPTGTMLDYQLTRELVLGR